MKGTLQRDEQALSPRKGRVEAVYNEFKNWTMEKIGISLREFYGGS